MLAFRGAMMECQHGKKVPVFAGIIIYRPDTRSAVARLVFSRQSEPMGAVKEGRRRCRRSGHDPALYRARARQRPSVGDGGIPAFTFAMARPSHPKLLRCARLLHIE